MVLPGASDPPRAPYTRTAMDLTGAGKLLLVLAAIVALFGLVLILMGRGVIPRIPGNLSIGRGSVRVFIPVGVCVVVSIVATVLLNLLLRR